jgi:hypothetical protein
MRIAAEIDISEFMTAMDKAKLSNNEVADVITAGAAVVMTAQKLTVPVDTGATRLSIRMYQITNNEWEIGPTTEYAPYIEYGTSNPNYPIQPFVVPSGTGLNLRKAIAAIGNALIYTLRDKGLL